MAVATTAPLVATVHPVATVHRTRMSISHRGLYLIYAVLPISLAAIVIDQILWGGHLKQSLPRNPEELRILTVFVVFPHIVASAVSFADAEYISFYKQRLIIGVALAIVLGLILPQFSMVAGFAVYALYTVYHVVAQQVGMTTLMTGKPTRVFVTWKWLMIVTSWIVYFLVFDGMKQPHIQAPTAPLMVHHVMQVIALSLLAPLAVSTFLISRASATPAGRKYAWANFYMVLFSVGAFLNGYSFFAIFAPRLIHDLSGFYFYVVHDHNRNLDQPRNAFYRLFGFTRLPMVFLSPVLAIILANALMQTRSFTIVLDFMMGLAFFHYYTEGFMWKRESIHRLAIGKLAPIRASPATASSSAAA